MEGFKTRLWVFSTINDQPNHWQNGRMETNISRTCHNNFSRWNLISIEDNCYLYHAVTFLGVLKTSLYKKKALKPHLQQEISLDTPWYFLQKKPHFEDDEIQDGGFVYIVIYPELSVLPAWKFPEMFLLASTSRRKNMESLGGPERRKKPS